MKRTKLRRGGRIALLVVGALLLIAAALFIEARIIKDGCTNPYSSLLVRGANRDALASLTRLDEDGYLYEITFEGDFEESAPSLPLSLLRMLRVRGCTAFAAATADGTAMVARNYDYPHYDGDGERDGVIVAVHCNPDGKYASVGLCDTFLLDNVSKNMTHGCLDDGKGDNSLLYLLPYLCVDGVNEKGLCVTVEYLPPNEGESPTNQTEKGKDDVIITELVRLLLDNCATLEEAIAQAQAVNLVNVVGSDYHLLVADADGNCAVFEWRYNTFTAVDCDISTNFYVGYDDAADFYEEGEEKEAFPGAADTAATYHYGFGYGFWRFNGVAEAMDKFERDANGRAIMTTEEILETIAAVRQPTTEYNPSFTQYTEIFDLSACSITVYAMPDYNTKYVFTAQ